MEKAIVCKERLDMMADKYLQHRYDTEHDKFIWQLVLEGLVNSGHTISHLGFSENL